MTEFKKRQCPHGVMTQGGLDQNGSIGNKGRIQMVMT